MESNMNLQDIFDQPGKAKSFRVPTDQTRAKMRQSQQTITNNGERHNARKVTTPAGEFISIRHAATHYQTYGDAIRRWIKNHRPGFYYTDDPYHSPLTDEQWQYNNRFIGRGQKSIQTPIGIFTSLKLAIKAHKDRGLPFDISKKLVKDPANYYYLES